MIRYVVAFIRRELKLYVTAALVGLVAFLVAAFAAANYHRFL